jgi:hypothetical protein
MLSAFLPSFDFLSLDFFFAFFVPRLYLEYLF